MGCSPPEPVIPVRPRDRDVFTSYGPDWKTFRTIHNNKVIHRLDSEEVGMNIEVSSVWDNELKWHDDQRAGFTWGIGQLGLGIHAGRDPSE